MNKKRYIEPKFVEMDARSLGYYMKDDNPMFAVSMEEEGTIHAKETDDDWEEVDDWEEWE